MSAGAACGTRVTARKAERAGTDRGARIQRWLKTVLPGPRPAEPLVQGSWPSPKESAADAPADESADEEPIWRAVRDTLKKLTDLASIEGDMELCQSIPALTSNTLPDRE